MRRCRPNERKLRETDISVSFIAASLSDRIWTAAAEVSLSNGWWMTRDGGSPLRRN
jgi:hypothetical protein